MSRRINTARDYQARMMMCAKGNASGTLAARLIAEAAAGQNVGCDACDGQGWPGGSLHSGEPCEACDGLGAVPNDEAMFPKLAKQARDTHGDFGRIVAEILQQAEDKA